MKILSHITWAAVIVLALASISSCREDSEEKYNPNFLYYGTYVQQFDAVYNGILYSYPYWDVDTADIIGRHDYWRAKAAELDKQDSVDNEVLEKIYTNMYGTLLDHHMAIRVKNLKPLPSQADYAMALVIPGNIEVRKRSDYAPSPVYYNHVPSMISKLQEQGRVTECCSWQTDDDFILVSCLIDSDILYFYLSSFDLTGHIGQDKSEDNIMVNKVVDNYLNIISTKQDLKGVIIDVRGNGGGWVKDQWTVLGALIDTPRLLFSSRRKNGTGLYDYDPFVETYVSPHKYHLLNKDAKIVGLCDMRSMSCAEAASSFIKHLPNGHLIGNRTFGGTCVLNGVYDADYSGTFGSIDGNHFVYLPTYLVLYGEERALYEGVGVTPDETVPYDEQLFKQTHEDNQLSAAINYIHAK